MASKAEPERKSIDDIEEMREMIDVMDSLNIKIDKKDGFEEMMKKAKEKINEQSSGSGQYSKGTTGFSVVSNAKDEDVLKREKLVEFFNVVNDCIGQSDKELLNVINADIPDIVNALHERRQRLGESDYHLLVAGESSAGKSSLLNLILGEELLPHHILNTTSTICELKYGAERKIVIHYKPRGLKPPPETHLQPVEQSVRSYQHQISPYVHLKDREEACLYQKMEIFKHPPPETHYLQPVEQCGRSYQHQISPYVHLKDRKEACLYEKVEIFWPHELLKKGVVIVDTPGLGESDVMDEVLMNYLPNAFAFMYVIDLTRAGGLQQDFKYKLSRILDKLRSQEVGSVETNRLDECSLFVCNKWDQIKENERDDVKNSVLNKLRECWPKANLNSQVVFLSTTNAIKAQQYGGITTEFENLLQSIKLLILKAINIRLYNHWIWLDDALYCIHNRVLTFNNAITSADLTRRTRMDSIKTRLEKIKENQENVQKEMQKRLVEETQFLYNKVSEFIKSEEFKMKFCRWTGSNPFEGETWGLTTENVMKAIENKFNEFVFEWEEDKKFYSKIHNTLVGEFLERFNLIEEELLDVDMAIYGYERLPGNGPLESERRLPFKTKILVGATAPLWVPLGVAGLIVGMPVLGVITVGKGVVEKKYAVNYRQNPRDYLEQRCGKFVNDITDETIRDYVKKQMQETEDVLTKYSSLIPRVIEANQQMVHQLIHETRSQEEVLRLYRPIEEKASEERQKLLPLGVQLCPAAVDSCDVEWKQDTASCVGEGEFALVYRGSLKTGESNTAAAEANVPINVVVKVFKQAFDNPNSRSYLYEETEIRHLNHKNVLRFYGAMQLNPSSSRNTMKIAFVMKFCEKNLRKVIFEDMSATPAKAHNSTPAIVKFLNWAIGIADGLRYIHEQRLVHRHLKLENILVDKNGTAMISDIGVVGQYLETEKSIMYLAPEVLHKLQYRTKEADVYSFGIMLWEMWYGTQAFTELMPLNRADFQKKIAGGHHPLTDEIMISLPRVNNIMENCWKTDPNERFSAQKCLEEFVTLQIYYA